MHHDVATERFAFLLATHFNRRSPPEFRTKLCKAHRAGHDLLIRRGHKQLVGVVRVQGVATFWINNQNAPMRISELRIAHHRVNAGAQL